MNSLRTKILRLCVLCLLTLLCANSVRADEMKKDSRYHVYQKSNHLEFEILVTDLSYKNTDAFIRKIDDAYSQLSNGLKSFIIKFSAEYVFSQQLNIRFFYDRTASTP